MKNVKLNIQRFSHTNSTTNYGFPQFVGTDKPAWLSDVNNFASDADTAIKQAKDRADSAYTLAGTAEGKADLAQGDATSALNSAGTANTNIGTMANLPTSDKSSLVNAIIEIVNNFNLTNSKTFDVSDMIGVGNTPTYSTLKNIINDNNSIFKLWGIIVTNVTTAGTCKITVNSDLRPDSEYAIGSLGCLVYNINNEPQLSTFDATIKTNGDIDLIFYSQTTGERRLYLPPCLYFNKSFGDTPQA